MRKLQYPYTPPLFLQNQTVDEIHRRMLGALPDNMDKSEGQIPWDFTRPTAIEKAQFVEFNLNEAIKIMFPQWAYGTFLDMHAEMVDVQRRSAVKATGFVKVEGEEGVIIDKGFQFATSSTNNVSSVLFETTEIKVIDESGICEIALQALEGGLAGNVAENTITLMVNPVAGIRKITNPNKTDGGMPEEDDETLRSRILEALKKGVSYVGNDSDYIRWGKEVQGVGEVVVVSEEVRPGMVKLIIFDMDGEPANNTILANVYNHIMSPGNRTQRLAPAGVGLEVVSAVRVFIDIEAKVSLKGEANLDIVVDKFKQSLASVCMTAKKEGRLNYVQIGASLAKTEGVSYYEDLFITAYTDNEMIMEKGKNNITITIDYSPVVGEVILDEKI